MAKRLLAASQSASLAGQVCGAGLAGVVLAQGWITQGLLCAALAYAASAGALALGTRGYEDRARPRPRPEPCPGGPGGDGEPEPVPLRWTPALVGVLVFSVPGSGALQFLNTVLVPLAGTVAPGRPSYYALLNIVTIAGGSWRGCCCRPAASPPGGCSAGPCR